MTHPAQLPPETLLSECDVTFTRRSGPGGQNRNKVETAAILKHRPTGLVAEANERRSQAQNREVALFRLRLGLALSVRSEPSDAPVPSALWRSRLKGGRILVNPEHPDFPALVAEALDSLAQHGHDARAAADALSCTPTQLIKLLKDEPRALALLNEHRKAIGLPAYR